MPWLWPYCKDMYPCELRAEAVQECSTVQMAISASTVELIHTAHCRKEEGAIGTLKAVAIARNTGAP